jgi:hypothetical protein
MTYTKLSQQHRDARMLRAFTQDCLANANTILALIFARMVTVIPTAKVEVIYVVSSRPFAVILSIWFSVCIFLPATGFCIKDDHRAGLSIVL